MKNLFRKIGNFLPFAGSQRQPSIKPESQIASVTLEQQLETLAQLGLAMNDGISVDDFLYSWNREEYEARPYDMVLFMLGTEVEREPEGRRFCDRAWNFDTECINDTGDYVSIVENLCRVAGMPRLITDAEDFVDIENETAWLKYSIEGEQRRYDIAVDNDWADPKTVADVMADIERDGKRFYSKDNGQASVWFYLDQNSAETLNRLSGDALKREDLP
jgi:hypothetical protein